MFTGEEEAQNVIRDVDVPISETKSTSGESDSRQISQIVNNTLYDINEFNEWGTIQTIYYNPYLVALQNVLITSIDTDCMPCS